MLTLTFTSCMAPRADAFCAALTRYMGDHLQIATTFVGDIPWQERERRFDAGAIDRCWICGLPYVWRADRGQPALELLAAPVMLGQRLLAAEQMARFVPIDDRFYDAIRQMDHEAVGVRLTTSPSHDNETFTTEHTGDSEISRAP